MFCMDSQWCPAWILFRSLLGFAGLCFGVLLRSFAGVFEDDTRDVQRALDELLDFSPGAPCPEARVAKCAATVVWDLGSINLTEGPSQRSAFRVP